MLQFALLKARFGVFGKAGETGSLGGSHQPKGHLLQETFLEKYLKASWALQQKVGKTRYDEMENKPNNCCDIWYNGDGNMTISWRGPILWQMGVTNSSYKTFMGGLQEFV